MAVDVTSKAVGQLRRVIESQKKPANTGFRLSVKGGGCAGFEYKMDFESTKQDFDEEFEYDGMKFWVDRKSFFFLNGVQLDFEDSNPLHTQFVWRNPNATSTCGCGTSFSA